MSRRGAPPACAPLPSGRSPPLQLPRASWVGFALLHLSGAALSGSLSLFVVGSLNLFISDFVF